MNKKKELKLEDIMKAIGELGGKLGGKIDVLTTRVESIDKRLTGVEETLKITSKSVGLPNSLRLKILIESDTYLIKTPFASSNCFKFVIDDRIKLSSKFLDYGKPYLLCCSHSLKTPQGRVCKSNEIQFITTKFEKAELFPDKVFFSSRNNIMNSSSFLAFSHDFAIISLKKNREEFKIESKMNNNDLEEEEEEEESDNENVGKKYKEKKVTPTKNSKVRDKSISPKRTNKNPVIVSRDEKAFLFSQSPRALLQYDLWGLFQTRLSKKRGNAENVRFMGIPTREYQPGVYIGDIGFAFQTGYSGLPLIMRDGSVVAFVQGGVCNHQNLVKESTCSNNEIKGVGIQDEVANLATFITIYQAIENIDSVLPWERYWTSSLTLVE